MKVEKHQNDITLTKIALFYSGFIWLIFLLIPLLWGFRGPLLLFTIIKSGMILLVYLGLCLFFTISTARIVSYIRGNSIKVSQNQFPDILNIVTEQCNKFNIKKVPEVYILESGGFINAAAVKLFYKGKDCIILFSDIIDPLYVKNDKESLKMVISHELGHIKENHISIYYHVFLLPFRIIPLLGLALTRAWEYTCDRYAVMGCSNLSSAQRGMCILACGKELYNEVNINAYKQQYKEEYGFWHILARLMFATHPYTIDRIISMERFYQNQK